MQALCLNVDQQYLNYKAGIADLQSTRRACSNQIEIELQWPVPSGAAVDAHAHFQSHAKAVPCSWIAHNIARHAHHGKHSIIWFLGLAQWLAGRGMQPLLQWWRYHKHSCTGASELWKAVASGDVDEVVAQLVVAMGEEPGAGMHHPRKSPSWLLT
eukprot:391960-Amphidinium_carterae.2